MKNTRLSFLFVFVFLTISFFSCEVEIGLGSAVDTKEPEVTIQNPPAGSVIRDVFAMSGTCADDGTIMSIAVEVKQLDVNEGDEGYRNTFYGDFNQKDGYWECKIDPFDTEHPIPDGSYEATVMITDGTGKQTDRNRQYTIDNTAPILAITRPSCVVPEVGSLEDSTDFDSYGQDFVIEGHVSDTCERRYISVDIYDTDGNLKYQTFTGESEQLIKIDSDFSTAIASFHDDAYNAIYGEDDEAGTKKYSCAITVYDSAKKYPIDGSTPEGDDAIGNRVEYFYLYEGDLYNDVFDAYGMTNAYKLVNGSFSEDELARVEKVSLNLKPEEALSALKNTKYQETRGFLSLNPKNNPYFKVSGHEPFDKAAMEGGIIFDDTEHHIINNSTMVVEVYPGLDQTPLIQENLGLYLVKADNYGQPEKNAEKIWLVEPKQDLEGKKLITDAEKEKTRDEAITKIGSTYKFTVYLSTLQETADGKFLESGSQYIIGVEGWDKKSVQVKNTDAIYGFQLVESGTAPVLTIKSIEPEWITTNVNTTENPDVVTENAAKKLSINLLFDGDDPYQLDRAINNGDFETIISKNDSYRESSYTDVYTPATGSGNGTLKYILTANNNLSSRKDVEYKVDNTRPDVISVTVPNVNQTENSSFKFLGLVNDNDSGIADVQIKFADEASLSTNEPLVTDWVSVGNSGSWNYNLVFAEDEYFKNIFADSTGKTIEGKKLIYVRAIDETGNISEVYNKQFIYDTNDPELKVTEYKQQNEEKKTISNNFFASQIFSIFTTITDNYGIESVVVKQIYGEGANAIENEIENISGDQIVNGQWEIKNLPRNTDAERLDEPLLQSGIFKYQIIVQDKTKEKKVESSIYNVTIDLDIPEVSITSPSEDCNPVLSENESSTISGSSFRFTGQMSDGTGTGITSYSYKFVPYGTDADQIAWITTKSTADNWSILTELSDGTTSADASSLHEGMWTMMVKATDVAGNESEVAKRTFVVDKANPGLVTNITQGESCQQIGTIWYFANEVSGKITYSDTFGFASEKPYTFKLGNYDITNAVNVQNGNWSVDSALFEQCGDFADDFDFSSLENIEQVLTISVRDKVGKTNSASYTIYKDTIAPVIGITYPVENDPISDANFTARGSVSDGTGVGIESLEYRVNDESEWTTINSGITGTSWTQNLNFSDKPEGNVTLYIRAKDKFGKLSTPTSVNFFYDKQNPQILLNNDDVYYVNSATYTLSGKAYDTNMLSYVTIADDEIIYSSASTPAAVTLSDVSEAKSLETAATWSKVFTTGLNGNISEGSHTLKVLAYDSSNRVSSSLSKEIFVDTVAPVVSTVAIPAPSETEESYYQFSGTTNDELGGQSGSQQSSGVDKVLVKFSDGTKSTDWIEASGTTRWTLLVTYANEVYREVFGSEGSKTIFVKVIDKAGNESSEYSRNFIYDKAIPTVNISSYTVNGNTTLLGTRTSFDVRDVFSISGVAADSYALKKIEILQTKNTEDPVVIASITADGTNKEWTITDLPRAENSIGISGTSDVSTDATYKYAVKVYDNSSDEGKAAQSSTLAVRIDKTAPEVTVSTPSANLEKSQALAGSSYTFNGTVTDAGVGLEKYQYAFTTSNTLPTEWETAYSETGLWQVEKALVSGTQPSSTALNEGQWYFWIKANDTAGNECTPVSRSFYVDLTKPTLSAAVTTNASCLLSSSIYYFTGENLTGTVSASDTYGLKSVTYKLGDDVITPVLSGENNNIWSIPSNKFTNGEIKTLTITAEDLVGKTSFQTFDISYDTSAPVVEIAESSLREGASVSSFPLTIYGTVNDGTGIGADTIYYSLDGSDPSNAIILNGTSWSKEITDASYTEGEIALKLKIKDKLGNISSVNTINFYYDINTPELTETSVGESGLTTNSAITLGGTASDSNELASVVITDSFNSNSRWTIPAAVMTGNTWVQNISLGTGENQLADGTHNFTITATDIVGKTTKLTRSVVIDATIPEVAVTAPATRIYSKNSNYRFEGTASDNIGINSLTAKLFKVVEGGDDEEIQSDNVNVNAGNWNWTVYELDNSSTYYGKFIVEDVGNNTNEAISQIIIADYTAPNSTLNFNGTAINNNSTSITNSAYILSGTIDEYNFSNAEGYATIKIDSGNPENLTVTAEKTWTYTGLTEEGTHSYVFRFKDLAGNESSYTVNVNYDTTAPEILTITTPATDDASGANAISGSTKTFSGNVSDAGSGLASYSYAFTQSSTAPTDSSTEWTTVNADNGTWSVSRTLVATTSAQAECLHEGEWYLYLKAEDKAGNKSQAATVRHFWVDQSAPALSNVNLTGNPYYFNENNLEVSGKAIDTYALDESNAVVIKKGTETVASIGSADISSDGSWSTTVTGIVEDIETELSIEVKDKVGKSSGVSTYRVYKDQTSPEISNVEPSSSAEMTYKKSQNYQFSGKTTDANLAEARAVLYKDGSATSTTTVLSPDATGNWTWKVYDLDNASYNIKITAEDKAGNVSIYTTGAIKIDINPPESTLEGTGLYENDGTTTVTTLTSNGTAMYYAKSAYTLSGVVTDDNFTYSAESVVVKENNTQVTVGFEGTAPGYTGWKYTPSITADGTYNYSITVKDKAENESTYNVTVVYDTTAPVVTISSPTSISYPSLDSANGNVSDNGIGIKSVKWSTDNSTWSENIWTGPLWNANLTSMEDEGSVTLYVKAEDWFGKETTTSVSFSLDKYNPSVSETDTVTEYQKAGYSFTLSGEAGDTNAIDYISITDGTNVYATTAAADSTDAARLTAVNAAVTIPVTNGSRDLTEESGKGKNWNITFSSADEAPLAQGRHNFIITAKDTANKYATSITKDIFIDTIAPEVLSAVLPNGNSTENDSFTFTGTAKDNNDSSTDSKIAKVEVKFGSYASETAATATAETAWLEANGSTSWKYQAVFTDESVNNVFGTNEGWKKITVRATDEAGNVSEEYTSTGFLYDKGNPTTTINKYIVGSDEQPVTNGQSFFVNGNFKLNFTVNDGYQVSSVEIKQNGTVIETLTDVNLASQTITVENLPRNAENTALTLDASSSGSYVYTINVKDKADKSAAEAKVIAKIDLSKPTISISTPDSDPADSTTYSSGSSKTFSGEVSDPEISAGVAGAGVESYFYQFTQSATEPTSGWNTVSYTQNDWTLVKSLVSGTTLGANGELCEGEWYLWMYAVDKAGNESNKVKRHFWLDQNVPEFDTNQPTITEVDSAVVKSGSTYYFNSGLSGTVSATDTSGKPVTYSYKIGEGAPVSISGTNWSIPSSSFTADGSYTVTIIATDYCGRQTAKDFVVIRDTTAPEVEVISPNDDEIYKQSTITPKGSVYDSGVGVKQLYYYSTLTETTVEQAKELSASAWTPLGYTGGASWSNPISLSLQGQVNFFIIAEDKLGQKTEPQKRVFYYDRDLPKVTQTTTVNEYQKENYSFTLTGKAWDSNSLDYVKITDGTNVYSSKASEDSTGSARVTIGTTSTAKTEETGAIWSITFSSTDTVPLAQGNHSFKVVSVDTAGRASDDPDESGNRDVISIDTFVDSIKPQLSITTPTVTYTKASTITFNGTLTEANLDELTVKLYRDETTDAVATETVSPRNGGWTYKATPEVDGKYYITAEATDIAGNSSGIATTSANKVTVDYTAPTTTIVGTGLTTETAGTATVEANGKYYAKGAFTLSGNVTEEYLKSVKVNGTDVTPESGNAWTKTYAASDLTEGTADYTVSLEDEAGNTNSYKVTVTYDKTAPTTTVASNVTSGFTNGSSITYSGTITETNLYQAELTLIKDGTATGTTTTVDSKNWTWKVTDLEEGTYTVKAIVKDKAGNTNGTGTTGGEVTVDKTAPVTTVSGTNLFDSSLAAATTLTGGSTYYAKAAYGLSGTVTEENLQSATYQIDSDTPQTLNNTWSLTAQTGTHKYTFKLKDKAGNEETYVIDVKYDNTAPVVTITTPAQNITDPNLAISSDEYLFRINATDGSGVGVKEIKYGFSSTSTTEPDAWVTDSNFTDGDKYFTMDVLNGTTGLDAEDGKLPEGTWYLWTQAKDRSANESTYEKRTIIVDKSNPTLTVSPVLSESGTNAVYSEVTSSGLTFSGTASDTNALDSTTAVVIKVDGITKATLTGTQVASGWNYTVAKGTTDGTLISDGLTTVEITAKDVVGKTTAKKYTVYYDTKTPELEITSPTDDEPVETSAKVIKGTVSDEGYGLASLEFELRDSSGTVVQDTGGKDISGSNGSGNYRLTVKGEQWFVADSEGRSTSIPLGTTEGALQLYVKATENAAGSRVTEKTVDFYYDTANPSVEETGIGTAGKTTNANFTLSGTAYDTNQLAKIEIKEGSAVIASTAPADGQGTIICASLATAKSEATKATWTAEIAASGVTDGTHSYTVIATDISGKESQLTRVVTMDKTAPSVTLNTVTATGITVGSQTWYGTRSIPVSITASDGTGSGVTSVEYAVGSNENTATWKALANTGSAFEGNIQFTSDGEQTYYVRAKDVAGNYTQIADRSSMTVYIDSTTPNAASLLQVDGQTLSGTKLTNKADAIVFTFTASDNTTAGAIGTGATGIGTPKLVKIGSTELGSNAIDATLSGSTYSITIPTTKIENGAVTVSVEDKVGNTTETTLFQITVDNEYPSTSVNPISDADNETDGVQVNKTFTITGTANDNNTLQSVKLQWGNGASPATWTDYNAANTGSNYNWSFDVDSTSSIFTDGNTYSFRAIATDTAGNVGNSGTTSTATVTGTEKTVIISQDSDRPILKINNLKLENPSDNYYWLKDTTLYGDISDDDGIKNVYWKVGSTGTYSSDIYTNGSWSINGLSEGTNDIYFKVVDDKNTTFETGSVDSKIKDSTNNIILGTSGANSGVLKIKVDTLAPTISDIKYYKSSSATLAASPAWVTTIEDLASNYTGGTDKYIYITFTPSDMNGIDSNGTTVSFANQTATASTENIKVVSTSPYIVRIDASAFTSGTSNLVITAKDNAGRTTSETKEIKIDVTAPTVTLNNFVDADTSTSLVADLNGTIEISGTANDNVELASVVVQYRLDETEATWQNLSTITESLEGWSIDVDTTTAFTDETTYYVRVKAIDVVGNEGFSTSKKIKVSQETDIPKIRITNIRFEDASTTPWLKNINTLYGIVTDDDGNVKSLQYRIGTTGDYTTLASAATSGSFEITDIPDGEQTIYFKVQDAVQTGTTVFENSVITDGTTNWGASTLTLKVDKTIPVISEVKYSYYDNASTEENKWSTFSSETPTVGGNFTKVKVQFKASDANAIETVSGTFNGTAITFTCADATYSDTAAHVWTSGEISVPTDKGTTAQEIVVLSAKAKDGAGLESELTANISIDNATPTFTFTSPSSDGAVLYGVSANTIGGNSTSADIAKREFIVTQTAATSSTTGWTEITDEAVSSITLVFDGTTGTTDGFHTNTLRSYLESVYNKTQAEVDADDTNRDLYINVRITDSCGNSSIISRMVTVIPNGDKPQVTIDYPESDGGSLAGTIRLSGTSEAAIGGIKGVYVQIDTDYDETTGFTADWTTGFNTCISGKDTNYGTPATIGSLSETGIKANGTQNWNLQINGKHEFNPTGTATIRNLAIKVYAVSNSDKASEPVIRIFNIDPNAPRFGGTDEGRNPLELVQKDGSGNITARVPYTSEMWVKGNWYLVGSVSDDGGIKDLTLSTGNNSAVQDVIKNGSLNITGYATVNNTIPGGTGSNKNWDMCIPLSTGTSSGKLTYTLVATEGGGNGGSSQETITINYDNTPPSIALDTHDQYSIVPKVEQSNGFYTLKSFASDNDSGMSRVAFYFLRRTDSGTKIYDPMINNTSVAISGSDIVYSEGLYWIQKTVTISDNEITLSAEDTNIHVGTLVEISGSFYKVTEISNDGLTITLNTPASTSPTAKFALALVVDNMDKKESASGSVQTTTGYGEGYYSSPANDDGDRMVEVWDGTSSSGQWQAQINSSNIPDGPIEIHYVAFDKSLNYSVGIVGNVDYTTYSGYSTADVTESATLKAANTDDSTGKVASHFVYSYGGSGHEAYVSNNAPRLVGVTFGCDYSGNGEIEESEKQTRYYSTANRFVDNLAVQKPVTYLNTWISSTDNTENGNAWAVVKDMSSVQFEVVGGNGDLFYEWQIDDSYADIDGSTHLKTEKNTSSFDSIDNSVLNLARQTEKDENGLDYYNPNTLEPIYLGRKAKSDNSGYELDTSMFGTGTGKLPDCDKSNANAKWWSIKVWDSTENTTEFEDSQYAMLILPISIQIQDTIAPRTVFNDLYWNSSTDNSVYKDPSTDALLGHVELKDDLYTLGADGTTKTAKNATMESTYGIDDDKVSGKVVFRGYAWDNKRLGSLRWGITTEKGNVGDATKANTDASNAKQAWPQQYVADATYTNGTWSTSGTENIGLPYYYLKVYDDAEHGAYLNGDGHKVMWELIVDTSHVQEPGKEETDDCWAVGKDLYVWVQATDAAATTNTTNMNPSAEKTDGTDEENIRPNYKVDVVPYITGISSILEDNRSSNGRYQISASETGVALTGYNLKVDNANLAITAAKGEYSTTIHGCPTINNINNNNACGGFDTTGAAQSKIATNSYNYQATSYNYTLTDDVVIDLWDINSKAAQTNSGISLITSPAMDYSPTTGLIGFSFADGANYYSQAGTVSNKNYSYYLWEKNYAKYVCNVIRYDSKGNPYAISVGQDTYPDNGKAGRMSLYNGSWGASNTTSVDGNFNQHKNSIHLDAIGLGDANIPEGRFNSISITSSEHTANNTTTTTLYVAYYDLIRDEIIFRWGNMSTYDNMRGNNKRNYGQLVPPDNEPNTSGFAVGSSDFSTLAGGSTPNTSGDYVALGVVNGDTTADDVVCAVWYDGRNLMYSYKVNPCNDHDAKVFEEGDETDGYWTDAQTLITNGGQYCKLEVDSNKGIHIVSFDQDNKAIGYVYLPTYDTVYVKNTHYHIIDAQNGPYDYINLDVVVDSVGEGGKSYPTISYYANGLPKMATYSAGVTKDGVMQESWENNSYTGKWDVCFVPTGSKLLNDNICVAVPHGPTGVRQNIKQNGSTAKFDTVGSKGSGIVSGNETENPILGYAVRVSSAGYIEIAQRQ